MDDNQNEQPQKIIGTVVNKIIPDVLSKRKIR